MWKRKIAGLVALATVLAFPALTAATHGPAPTNGLVSLAGSNFEIDSDANLRPDHASPSIDWETVNENRNADSPSGSGDESFTQGSKEDTAEPVAETGSIPPNKSDLKFFGVHQEGEGGSGFLNIYWARVQDPSGTTNMDFEFNKRFCTPNATPADTDCTANGITPKRTAGDMLIIYDLSRGGTVPTLSLRRWTGTAWGAPSDLTASNDATGAINGSTIMAGNADGLGQLDPRTFGEAQIDLSAVFGEVCDSFGSVYLKSRSSDSFTAALKDFVPPANVNVSNCGALSVAKYIDSNENGSKDAADVTALSGDLTGWTFSISGPDGFSCTGTTDATGALTGGTCTASALTGLAAGTYTVTETGPASKKIGTGGAFNWINTDPGGNAPLAKNVQVTINGNATVLFGNSCLATANFAVNNVPAGVGAMFVEYEVDGGPSQTATLSGGTGTRTASVAGLRTGDAITWRWGISSDPNSKVSGTGFSLLAYPACSGSQSDDFVTATITATKYRDSDANGARGTLEPGLAGFKFELRKASDGTKIAETISATNGAISFSNVVPGSYQIHEVDRPTGWRQTDPGNNGHRSISVVAGDTSKDAGLFGNTPLSRVTVTFTPLAVNPGTTTPATRATSISCGSASTTTAQSLTTGDLTTAGSPVDCDVVYVDNP